MKKLNGMKSNFSSLENKKLENLQSVQGGASAMTYSNTTGPGYSDKQTFKDGALVSTLFVGC